MRIFHKIIAKSNMEQELPPILLKSNLNYYTIPIFIYLNNFKNFNQLAMLAPYYSVNLSASEETTPKLNPNIKLSLN